jgi:hypothetical protein
LIVTMQPNSYQKFVNAKLLFVIPLDTIILKMENVHVMIIGDVVFKK